MLKESILADTKAVFNREFTKGFLIITTGDPYDTPIFDKLVLEKGIHQ